jgi:MFS family permease
MTPFSSATFRRLWLSTLSSSGAQGIERTATAWLTLEAGGGASGVGLVFAARMLPSLFFGLAAGTIADRNERSRQLFAVATTALILMLGFYWLAASGAVKVWQVVAIAFISGCVQVFDTPARQSLVLDTVPGDLAERALALNALAGRLALALGAFAAGAIITFGGVARCYLAIAAIHGCNAALVATLRIAHTRRGTAALPPFSQALHGAARLIVDVPAIRILISAGVACEIFAFSNGTALPIVAQDVLRAGAEGLGTLNAAVAVGGTIAVLLLSLLPQRVRREPLLGAAFVVYGLSLLALGSSRSLIVATAILVVTGICAGAFDVLQQTLIQLAVPREQRGRAVGVWVLGLGSAPVGHLEMGFLIAMIGAPSALMINGSLAVLSAAILLVCAPIYRWGGRIGLARSG